MNHGIERFVNECSKIKRKVIILANQELRYNSAMNQSKFEANTCNRRQARENTFAQVTIGFGAVSHWLRKWREFFNQSQSEVKQG